MLIKFRVERSTKNTVRYREVTDGEEKVGILYVRKGALPTPPPKELLVSIQPVG